MFNQGRRSNYDVMGPQEQFIVPLLRDNINLVIENFAKPAPFNGKVLDVGCGEQPLRQDLEACGYTYLSLDIQQNNQGTVDIIGSIDQPLNSELIEKGPFDLVICTEVMEHVANWQTAFDNFTFLMEKGNKLLITCPHFFPLHEEPYDYWRPTPYALKHFASRNGFEVLYQASLGNAWDLIGTIIARSHPVPKNNKLLNKLVSRLLRLFFSITFRLLVHSRIQNIIQIESPFYLSNIILIERS